MGSQNDSRVAEAEQARQRLVQEREAARASRLFLGGSNPTPQSGASAGVSPITGDQAITRPIADAEASQASNNGVPAKAGKAFPQDTADRPTESAERLIAPVSPSAVQAGSIIPAALIPGIRSDTPVQLNSKVTETGYHDRQRREDGKNVSI